jgi:hypothetical protein
MDSTWKWHRRALGAVALVALGLTAVVWLVPSVGFAEPGSIIAGADLRPSLTAILWILFAVVAGLTSAVVALGVRSQARPQLILPVAYGVALVGVPIAFKLLDRYVF